MTMNIEKRTLTAILKRVGLKKSEYHGSSRIYGAGTHSSGFEIETSFHIKKDKRGKVIREPYEFQIQFFPLNVSIDQRETAELALKANGY